GLSHARLLLSVFGLSSQGAQVRALWSQHAGRLDRASGAAFWVRGVSGAVGGRQGAGGLSAGVMRLCFGEGEGISATRASAAASDDTEAAANPSAAHPLADRKPLPDSPEWRWPCRG